MRGAVRGPSVHGDFGLDIRSRYVLIRPWPTDTLQAGGCLRGPKSSALRPAQSLNQPRTQNSPRNGGIPFSRTREPPEGAGFPISHRRLSEIPRQVLRVECLRCFRIVEIQHADAVKLHGPHAIWKDVGQRLLDDGCQHRTGSREEDGCWPDF
jgi:hypothetical protein